MAISPGSRSVRFCLLHGRICTDYQRLVNPPYGFCLGPGIQGMDPGQLLLNCIPGQCQKIIVSRDFQKSLGNAVIPIFAGKAHCEYENSLKTRSLGVYTGIRGGGWLEVTQTIPPMPRPCNLCKSDKIYGHFRQRTRRGGLMMSHEKNLILKFEENLLNICFRMPQEQTTNKQSRTLKRCMQISFRSSQQCCMSTERTMHQD